MSYWILKVNIPVGVPLAIIRYVPLEVAGKVSELFALAILVISAFIVELLGLNNLIEPVPLAELRFIV